MDDYDRFLFVEQQRLLRRRPCPPSQPAPVHHYLSGHAPPGLTNPQHFVQHTPHVGSNRPTLLASSQSWPFPLPSVAQAPPPGSYQPRPTPIAPAYRPLLPKPPLGTTNGSAAPTHQPAATTYQSPTSTYQSPTTTYGSLAPGFQALTSGYQTSTPGYQPSSYGYQPTATGFQPSAPGFQSSAAGFQSSAPGFQSSAPGYLPTITGFQASAPGYQAPAAGYQASAAGYQASTPGYQASVPGYQASASGYQASTQGYLPTATVFQPSPPGYHAPAPIIQRPAPIIQRPAPTYQAPISKAPTWTIPKLNPILRLILRPTEVSHLCTHLIYLYQSSQHVLRYLPQENTPIFNRQVIHFERSAGIIQDSLEILHDELSYAYNAMDTSAAGEVLKALANLLGDGVAQFWCAWKGEFEGLGAETRVAIMRCGLRITIEALEGVGVKDAYRNVL